MKHCLFTLLLALISIVTFAQYKEADLKKIDSLLSYYSEHNLNKEAVVYAREMLAPLQYLCDTGVINDTAYAVLNLKLGAFFKDIGKYDSAEYFLRKVLDLPINVIQKAKANHAIFSIYNNLGKSEAITYLKNGLRLYKQILPCEYKKDKHYWAMYQAYGMYLMNNYPDSAETILLEVLKYQPEQYSSYYNLANLYKKSANFSKALNYQKEAIKIYEKEPNYDKAVSYIILLKGEASLLQHIGNCEESASIFERCLNLSLNTTPSINSNIITATYSSIAQNYSACGNLEKADSFFSITLKRCENMSFQEYFKLKLISYGNYAHFNTHKINNYAKADSLYSILEKEIQKDSLQLGYYFFLVNRGNNYSYWHKYEEADRYFFKAEQWIKNNKKENNLEYTRLLGSSISNCLRKKDFNCANTLAIHQMEIENLFFYTDYFLLSEQDRRNLWYSKDYNLHSSLSQYLNMGNYFNQYPDNYTQTCYNAAIMYKGLNFRISQKQINTSINYQQDTILSKEIDRWIALKNQYAKSKISSSNDSTSNEISFQLNEIERELARKLPYIQSALNDKNIIWEDIQKQLSKDEAAIEIVRFQVFPSDTVRYAALVITQSCISPKYILMKDGKYLEGFAFKSYLNCINDNTKDTFSYNQYWKPIAEVIGNAKTIYISPDGIYHKINLSILYDFKSKKHLLQSHDVRVVFSTKDIIKRKELYKHIDKAILVGNPRFSLSEEIREGIVQNEVNRGGFEPLPKTQEEVTEISSLMKQHNWRPIIKTDSFATEDFIKSVRNPRVLLIATHGFFDTTQTKNNPENALHKSGLYLVGAKNTFFKQGKNMNSNIDDGILTAYEASALRLDSTELVVLSACETGLGEAQNGEGVYGLQRAFRIAGAQSLIISLWNVGDNFTARFMPLFFEYWLSGKYKTKHEAFRQAQLYMIKKGYPLKDWGAFVLIGG